MSSHGAFAATCERCGDVVTLTASQQTRFIGLRGEFRCGSCGGMRPQPVTDREIALVPRAPRPKRAAQSKPKPTLTEQETRCCLKGEEPPTYFRPCPDCPAGRV